jgi:hypothetical protein
LLAKSKFESGSSYFCFKWLNKARSTCAQPGINLGSTCTALPRHSAVRQRDGGRRRLAIAPQVEIESETLKQFNGFQFQVLKQAL